MTTSSTSTPLIGQKRSFEQLEDSSLISPPPLAEKKLCRYRHPSHPHKLFRNLVRNMAVFCDNQNCKRRLYNNEVSYVCFRCNYDLCQYCYLLPTEPASYMPLHDSDEDINEDILFVPDRYVPKAKTVRILTEDEKLQREESNNNINDPNNQHNQGVEDDEDEDEEENEDEEEDYDEEDEDEDEDEVYEDDQKHDNIDNDNDDEDYVPPEIKQNNNNVVVDEKTNNDHEQKNHTNIPPTPIFSVTITQPQSLDASNSNSHMAAGTISFESDEHDSYTISALNRLLETASGHVTVVATPIMEEKSSTVEHKVSSNTAHTSPVAAEHSSEVHLSQSSQPPQPPSQPSQPLIPPQLPTRRSRRLRTNT
jgi:hypothetical protein